jgi:membrane dipeptidase
VERISRRMMLGILNGAFGAPAFLQGRFRVFTQSTTEYSARAIRLMEETTVVDLLNQFKFSDLSAPRPQAWAQAPFYSRWLHEPGSFTATDAAAFRQSGRDVFAIGSGTPDYTVGLQFLAEWNGFCAQYSDWVLRIDDPSDFERVRKEKKIEILLSMQRSEHFRTPNDVNLFWGQDSVFRNSLTGDSNFDFGRQTG